MYDILSNISKYTSDLAYLYSAQQRNFWNCLWQETPLCIPGPIANPSLWYVGAEDYLEPPTSTAPSFPWDFRVR